MCQLVTETITWVMVGGGKGGLEAGLLGVNDDCLLTSYPGAAPTNPIIFPRRRTKESSHLPNSLRLVNFTLIS